MGKSKEEDKIEKLIRGLLKLPENRRCINCTSLGPQYVCTTFWTFVCTNCSGVHREFTHRVKSVSMAKFTLEEVNALQAGGNERARQTYFKTWDPQRNSLPDNSNIHRLRDFIKHVYVDRRYTGESHPALVPRLKKSEKDEPRESRSVDSGEKPVFQERIDRYSRYSFDEVRSPRNQRENSRYGGSRGGSSRFEGADGRYQVDDARIAGRAATQMFTTEDIKLRRRSPDRHQNRDMNSPPPVRHVREIFGEKFLPLRVGDHPKPSDRRSVRGTAIGQQTDDHSKEGNRSIDGPVASQEVHTQQSGDHSRTNHKRSVSQSTVRSGSQASVSNALMKTKSESTGSLVDFATFPPPDAAIQNQPQQMDVTKDEGNSATSQPPVNEIVCSAPPKNTLEFLLFELAPPVDTTPKAGLPGYDNAASRTPSSNSSTSNHMLAPLTSGYPPTIPSAKISLQDPNVGLSEPVTAATGAVTSATGVLTSNGSVGVSISNSKPERSIDMGAPEVANSQTMPDLLGDDDVSTAEQSNKNHSPSIQQAEHSTPVSESSSAWQTCHSNVVTNTQPATLSLPPSSEVTSGNYIAQPPHPAISPTQETKSAVITNPSSAEARSGGRTELPADFFASLYASGPSGPSGLVPAPGWQTGPSHTMGFNMQYHPASMQIPAFPNLAKSTNPFDINDNTAPHQATVFSSMSSLQGGLPNVSAPPGLLRTSSFGSHVPGFPPTQSPSYSSAAAYMGQQLYNNTPPSRMQAIGGFVSEGGTPGTLNLNQQNPYAYPAPSNPGSFHTGGGNPFG